MGEQVDAVDTDTLLFGDKFRLQNQKYRIIGTLIVECYPRVFTLRLYRVSLIGDHIFGRVININH